MTIQLETKHFIIKAPALEYLDDICALESDPEVMRFVGGARTRETSYDWLVKAIQLYEKHGFSMGMLFEKSTGICAGRAGIVHLAYDDTQPDVEVGCRLHKAYWGKGYGEEILSAIVDWSFNQLGLTKLVGILHPGNEASRHIMEKIGMHYVERVHFHHLELAEYEIYKNTMDYSQLEVVPANAEDHSIMLNLARFYAYEISEFVPHKKNWEQSQDGLHDLGIDFEKYWEKENCFPFLVRYQGEWVGFMIVDKEGSNSETDFNMAQFFVLRRFKSKGIGRYMAYYCFNHFQGEWEITVMPGNEGAYRFWRTILKQYTNNNLEESTLHFSNKNNMKKNIFRFKSGVKRVVSS